MTLWKSERDIDALDEPNAERPSPAPEPDDRGSQRGERMDGLVGVMGMRSEPGPMAPQTTGRSPARRRVGIEPDRQATKREGPLGGGLPRARAETRASELYALMASSSPGCVMVFVTSLVSITPNCVIGPPLASLAPTAFISVT